MNNATMHELFDHPEPNHTVLSFVCEFWSVLTTIPVAGTLLVFEAQRMSLHWRSRVITTWVLVMYCSACLSHCTMIDPLFRVTVSLVVGQALFVFGHWSYLLSLRLGDMSAPLTMLLTSIVLVGVALIPQRLGIRGGFLSLGVIQTPGVFIGLLAARMQRQRHNGAKLGCSCQSTNEYLCFSGTLLMSAMVLSFIEYYLWDSMPSVLPVLGGFPLVHVAIHVLEQMGIYTYGLCVAVIDEMEYGRGLKLVGHKYFGYLWPRLVDIPEGSIPPVIDAAVLRDAQRRKDHPSFNAELEKFYPGAKLIRVHGECSSFLVKAPELVHSILRDTSTYASHPWPDGRIIALNTMMPEQHKLVKSVLSPFYNPTAVERLQKNMSYDMLDSLRPGSGTDGEPFCAIKWIGRVHMAISLHALGGAKAAAMACDPSTLDEFVRLNDDMVRLVAPLGGLGAPPPSVLKEGLWPVVGLLKGVVQSVVPLVSLIGRIGFMQTWALTRPDLTLWQGPCFPRTGTWQHSDILRSVPVYFAQLHDILMSGRPRNTSMGAKGTCVEALNGALDEKMLSKSECLAVMVQLMVNMTSRNAVLNMLHRLAADPQLQSELRGAGRPRIRAFLSEVLVLDTPLQRTPKRVLHDTFIDGTFIPKDSTLLLLLGAANAASCPHVGVTGTGTTSCPGREKPESLHMTFGAGSHSCLGRQLVLAEMETIVLFVLERAPALCIVGEAERLGDVDVGNYGWSQLKLAF